MKKSIRKTLEILIVVFIVLLSALIFIFRDKIQNIGNIGYFGLFLLCFIANATVLLPAPSLMIAASAALILNPIIVAICASLGSTLGEFVGYAFGTVVEDLSPRFKVLLDKLTSRIRNRTVLVFVLALLPLPLFDVAGIYSGGTKMNLIKFFLACLAGKFIKTLVYTRMYDILEWAYSLIPNVGGL